MFRSVSGSKKKGSRTSFFKDLIFRQRLVHEEEKPPLGILTPDASSPLFTPETPLSTLTDPKAAALPTEFLSFSASSLEVDGVSNSHVEGDPDGDFIVVEEIVVEEVFEDEVEGEYVVEEEVTVEFEYVDAHDWEEGSGVRCDPEEEHEGERISSHSRRRPPRSRRRSRSPSSALQVHHDAVLFLRENYIWSPRDGPSARPRIRCSFITTTPRPKGGPQVRVRLFAEPSQMPYSHLAKTSSRTFYSTLAARLRQDPARRRQLLDAAKQSRFAKRPKKQRRAQRKRKEFDDFEMDRFLPGVEVPYGGDGGVGDGPFAFERLRIHCEDVPAKGRPRPGYIVSYRHMYPLLKPQESRKSRGVVVCFHGVNMSSAYFGTMANSLRRAGFEIIAHDTVNHGRTRRWRPKKWGHMVPEERQDDGGTETEGEDLIVDVDVDSSDVGLDDREQPSNYIPTVGTLKRINWSFLKNLRKLGIISPSAPLFLVGSSLGSITVLHLLLHHDDDPVAAEIASWVTGIVLLSPPIKLLRGVHPGGFVKSLLYLQTKIVPGIRFTPKPDFKNTSRIKSMQPVKLEHPEYRFGRHPSKTAYVILEGVDRNAKRLTRLRPDLPILMAIGTNDDTCDFDGVLRLLSLGLEDGYAERSCLVYKDAYHRLVEDECCKEVIDDVVRWLYCHSTSE